LAGSGSMRTVRRAPPITRTCAVSGISASSRANSSPSLRNCPGVCCSPCSVSVRNGTSSMVSRRTIGVRAPVGMSSGWAASSWWILTRLGSCGSFTLKRTVINAIPGRLTLYRYSTPARPHKRRSSGVVSWLSTSFGLAPGYGTMRSTIGTMICGSSSRGVSTTASTPSSSDAKTMSGVSLLRRKVLARRPARPNFGSSCAIRCVMARRRRVGHPSSRRGCRPQILLWSYRLLPEDDHLRPRPQPASAVAPCHP
jgi:hypothetical protein